MDLEGYSEIKYLCSIRTRIAKIYACAIVEELLLLSGLDLSVKAMIMKIQYCQL